MRDRENLINVLDIKALKLTSSTHGIHLVVCASARNLAGKANLF